MPPKTKFTKTDILKAAFDLVRKQGLDALSTRAVARELQCSTMPVYTCLKSRKHLEEVLAEKAFEVLMAYQTTPRTGDIFIDMGMGYVLFARDEKHLFRCIHHEDHMQRFKEITEKHLNALVDKLAAYPLVSGLPREAIRTFFMQGWVYAHGLAHLINAGYYGWLEDAEIRALMEFTGQRYIKGFEAMKQGGK